jgi:tellurite resistance protein TerC
MTVPIWAWAAFCAFVAAMLAVDLFALHRRAREVSLGEAAGWSAAWVAIGLGFGGLLWAWRGAGPAQDYLAGYLIEKSLSVDNVFVFAVIFSAFAIPLRYQHRVLMLGIVGALVMRAGFIVAGAAALDRFHLVSYVFGAVLLIAAVTMARGRGELRPRRSPALRVLKRVLPASDELHGQAFLVRAGGRILATPLLLALIVIETTDVVFAVDSIPAILAVTTDTFVVFTSNVFALLGMRALYFLLARSAKTFRYLQPGLAVILAGVAAKMLTADLYEVPVWASPVFIAVVLAVVAALSVRDRRRQADAGVGAALPLEGEPAGQGDHDRARPGVEGLTGPPPPRQPAADPARRHPDGAVDHDLEGDEDRPQDRELGRHVTEPAVDELRQQRDHERDRLRVGQVGQQPAGERVAPGHRRAR